MSSGRLRKKCQKCFRKAFGKRKVGAFCSAPKFQIWCLSLCLLKGRNRGGKRELRVYRLQT